MAKSLVTLKFARYADGTNTFYVICRAVSPNITKKRKPAEAAAAAPPAKRAAPDRAAAACAAAAEGAAGGACGEQPEPSCSVEAGAQQSLSFHLLN